MESSTFDSIQYTYVIHEMPTANAKRFLQEAMRLLKPGGVLSGFEGKLHEPPEGHSPVGGREW